ncbi:MAG: hypothetical protein ABF820_07550, partial [Sporolactobacillus sp.]
RLKVRQFELNLSPSVELFHRSVELFANSVELSPCSVENPPQISPAAKKKKAGARRPGHIFLL